MKKVMIRIICTSITKKIFFWGTIFFFCFGVKDVFATNLLTNPGFEEGINNWSLTPSTATFSATLSFKHGGDYGAFLTKEESSSWAYFNQKVPVEADKYYQMSGWVLVNDGLINNVKLRFYWLDSSEAKISSTPVEIVLSDKDSSFQFLQTEFAIAPAGAQFADVQGYINLDQKNPPNPVIFDDLVFEQVPSPTPTTPVPTPTEPEATPTSPPPTATPTSQPPTNTPTPKPTLIPTIKPTPTLAIVLEPTESLGFGTEPSGDLSAEDILGMEASSGGEASSSSGFAGFIKNIPWFPVIAVGIGVLFIGFSLFTFIKGNRKIPPPNL